MALFDRRTLGFVEAISELTDCNPFLPRRIELERLALGDAFNEFHADWNVPGVDEGEHPNVVMLCKKGGEVLDRLCGAGKAVGGGVKLSDREQGLYRDLVYFVVYHRYRRVFDRTIEDGLEHKPTKKKVSSFESAAEDMVGYFEGVGMEGPGEGELSHLFACIFQMRRAYQNIFKFINGVSAPAVKLRADVWESIFSHDMKRYRRVLFKRMVDYTTLIVGPSGTGKELVARAVGLSRYIPFDVRTGCFTEDFAGTFYPLNLSAMSPMLIESELFGHKRGAFTGAVADRVGWLEMCPEMGTVFLDEIGELDEGIQVKLLRVLQTRRFNRLGETEERAFKGKVIAATNRNLSAAMSEGRFREDLYYRLCSDIIVTPPLCAGLADHPDELGAMLEYLAMRLVGEEEAVSVAEEVEEWVLENLGKDYPWPGNVRELEQCMRNVVLRKTYRPASSDAAAPASDAVAALGEALGRGELSADELLGGYCTIVYARCGSYEQAAKRLGLDRRTVKARIDEGMLAKLKGGM